MTSATSRLLAVCTFANEKTTSPKVPGQVPWSAIIEMHKRRSVRQDKTGPMLGGYAINGTRCDADVPFRSLIQLDIDTEGKKEATGRLLTVTRRAPPLDEVRPAIDKYGWCAASSHWHEPRRDVIKYRVVILPDRDILPDEHEPLLEALDERLGGALDRKAWVWSQAFYLPSCPAENEGDAFFVDNEGAPLPVDEFVRRGREIIAARQGSRAGSPKPDESIRAGEIGTREFPPSSALKIVKSCPTLAHVERVGGAVSERLWRSTLGVVKYTTEGAALCHEWSKGDPRYDQHETQKKIDQWTKAPTLCSTFRKIDDAKCQGCVQRCKSPIQLGHPDDADPMRVAMQEFNLRHFVAKVGGGVFVFDEDDRNILTDAMSFTAFQQFNAGRKINGKPVAAAWLSSSGRRTYTSLVFDPSDNCPEGNYNTWHGLAVEPKKGKCGKIITHIRDVWCSGDIAQFEYVMRWLALLVQRPWIKPEVALVLRSKEGTGKTIIVKLLLGIFGVHGFTTAQKDQVAGRFNGHLFDKVLVVLEEAFFAGDPAAVAQAKALVTNAEVGYEAKGKDAFSAPNYAHVIMLTNNEWAVPAGVDARRWMVLDVSEARMGDHAYFTALADFIANGGREAFLHYLMSIPLDGWNPRVLPRSDGLHAQQVETLRRSDPVAGWWLGALSEAEFPVEGGAVQWVTEISAGEMQESYAMATKGARNAPSFDVAAKKLRNFLPAGALSKVRKSHHGNRHFSYQLPELQLARQHFKTVTGIEPCAI